VKIDSKEAEGKLVWVGHRCQDTQEPLVQLFGYPAGAGGVGEGLNAPTRLTVRDGELLNEAKLSEAENTDMYCTEVKTEVAIDRLTSAANPRNFERVSAGAEFKLELVLDLYDIDVEENTDKKNGGARSDEFVHLLKYGLELLQDDYLGGQGTRGYGAVDIIVDSVEEKTAEAYRNGTGRTTSPYESIFSEFKCACL
jgi:CRISPR-associated protein Csm3